MSLKQKVSFCDYICHITNLMYVQYTYVINLRVSATLCYCVLTGETVRLSWRWLPVWWRQVVPVVLEHTEDISDQIHSLYHCGSNTSQDFSWLTVLCSDYLTYTFLSLCPESASLLFELPFCLNPDISVFLLTAPVFHCMLLRRLFLTDNEEKTQPRSESWTEPFLKEMERNFKNCFHEYWIICGFVILAIKTCNCVSFSSIECITFIHISQWNFCGSYSS